MDIKTPNHNEFLNFQISRNMIGQIKDCLIILEDFKKDGFLSEEGYSRLRGYLLGKTNDRIRDLQGVVEQFNIELRKT